MTTTIQPQAHTHRDLKTIVVGGVATVAIAVGAFQLGQGFSTDGGTTNTPEAVPAAVAGVDAVDLSGVSEWAREEGMSGLSPAGLASNAAPAPAPAHVPVDLTPVAEWAREEGLSGLSPASVGR